MCLFHTQCYCSGECRGRWRKKTGLNSGGFSAVLQAYAYSLLSFLPFLFPSLSPSPPVLKKSFPFMLCERTRWEKLQGLSSRSPWQPQGIPVRGDWWHGKVSQAPWGRGGRGREEAEVLEPVACGGESRERDERSTYISRGTMGVLLADCEKTHWGYNALWHMKALGTFPEPHSVLRSLVNILKCKENNPFHFLVLKNPDFKYYFRQLLLLVCWKPLQFAEFPLISCSGRGGCPEGPQSGLSEVSTCFLLIQLLFILRPVIHLLWMLSAIHATSSYSSRREEFLFPMSKPRSKLYDSKSRNETKQPKIRSPVVPARVHPRKPGWKAAYKDRSMTLAPWHPTFKRFTTQSQNQPKRKIGSKDLILQKSNLYC